MNAQKPSGNAKSGIRNPPAGARLDDCSRAAIASGVAELIADLREAVAGLESVVVVTDAYYPHHESTGLVTNPAVVAALCRELTPLVDRLHVLPAIGEQASASIVLDALGYDDVAADTGASVLSPDECPTLEQSVSVSDGGGNPEQVAVSLPAPLLDAAVVFVSTLRRNGDGMISPTARTVNPLLSISDGQSIVDRSVATAVTTELLAPELGVLDGTYVFTGRPRRARFLVGTTEPATLDAVGTAILGADRYGIDGLRSTDDRPYVAGLSIEALGRELSGGTSVMGPLLGRVSSPSGGGDELTARAYRAYARLAGDIVPPPARRKEADSL